MKRIIPILLAFCCASAWAKEPAATQAASGTRYGHRTLTVNSNEYAPDFNELIAFLNRRAAELGPTLVNIPSDKMESVLTISANQRPQGMELDLDFDPPELPNVRPAAKEFLNTLVASAESYTRDNFAFRRDRLLALAQRDLDVCNKQLAEATEEARGIRSNLRDVAGRADVSSQGITAAVSRLEEEKEKIELDLLGKKARREALEKEIFEQAKLMQTQADSDPVAKELMKIVEVREVKLSTVKKMVDSGQASQAELNDAIAAVAEARAKLAERQHGGAAASGTAGETLEALSRERVNLSVDLHELEARLEFVEKRLPPLRSAMDKLDALQRAEGDLNSAREALAKSTTSYRDMSRRLETADPPQVLVKSTADSDKPFLPGR